MLNIAWIQGSERLMLPQYDALPYLEWQLPGLRKKLKKLSFRNVDNYYSCFNERKVVTVFILG